MFQSNGDLAGTLRRCASGVQLCDGDFAEDVAMAAQLDVDGRAAALRDGVFAAG